MYNIKKGAINMPFCHLNCHIFVHLHSNDSLKQTLTEFSSFLEMQIALKVKAVLSDAQAELWSSTLGVCEKKTYKYSLSLCSLQLQRFVQFS